MSATLTRRIGQLEAAIPPPPDDRDAFDAQRWWDAAPDAVRRYCDAADALAESAGLDPLDGDEPGLGGWYRAHHPHLATILATVERFAAKGEPCPLGAAHHAVLADSFARLHAHYRAHLPSGGIPHTWIDATWLHGFGVGDRRGWPQAHEDRSGRTWVALWRASGTTDPDTRARMGLGGPELALLNADG